MAIFTSVRTNGLVGSSTPGNMHLTADGGLGGMNDVHATRQVCRPAEKTSEKKTTQQDIFFYIYKCKLETMRHVPTFHSQQYIMG